MGGGGGRGDPSQRAWGKKSACCRPCDVCCEGQGGCLVAQTCSRSVLCRSQQKVRVQPMHSYILSAKNKCSHTSLVTEETKRQRASVVGNLKL
eukprot:165566-Chlamydomonas_euryale.AAC.2